jgi:hypothetical protein
MNAFLESLRADLLGRRLRPPLALLAVALVGAIVYAMLAGSGSSTPVTAGSSASSASGGVAVSPIKTEAAEAIAETTDGGKAQRSGRTRNPFASLPAPKATKATQQSPSSSSSPPAGGGSSASATSEASSGSGPRASSGSGAGSSSGGSSAGGSSPAKPKTEKKRSQPAYEVSVVFGTAAPGTPPASAQLTPFERLTLQQPLPSTAQALVVYRGVVAGGKSATFTLVGEAILRGDGVCRPSTAQCQMIDLQVGQTEELEYAPPGAAATNYLLQVREIKSVKAHGASAGARVRESKAGAELLRNAGLQALPGLRYSTAKGVLVFAGHRAADARARIATVAAALTETTAIAVVTSEPQGLSASK